MSLTRRRLLRATAASGVALAGCSGYGGGDGGGGGATSPTATDTETGTATTTETAGTGTTTGGTGNAPDLTIPMKDTAFRTLKANVDAGATVEWVNEDGVAHTVTSAQFHDVAAAWDFDAQVSGGGSVTHTFGESGVYEYYCTVHGKDTMCGTVLVGGASLGKDLPCAEGGGGYGGGY